MNVQDFSCTKHLDRSSPILLTRVASGQRIPSADSPDLLRNLQLSSSVCDAAG